MSCDTKRLSNRNEFRELALASFLLALLYLTLI
jgi:hypothetical protein